MRVASSWGFAPSVPFCTAALGVECLGVDWDRHWGAALFPEAGECLKTPPGLGSSSSWGRSWRSWWAWSRPWTSSSRAALWTSHNWPRTRPTRDILFGWEKGSGSRGLLHTHIYPEPMQYLRTGTNSPSECGMSIFYFLGFSTWVYQSYFLIIKVRQVRLFKSWKWRKEIAATLTKPSSFMHRVCIT